jgi:hypothetical protein
MNTRQLRTIIAVLAVATIGLAITLGVVLARDDDDGSVTGMGKGSSGDSFMDMMMSMGAQDSEAMLGHMEEILGEEGFTRMMQHFQSHRDGGPMTGNADVDQMMHRMMDGMMQHMPQDSQDILPPDVDQHHEPPVAGTPAN